MPGWLIVVLALLGCGVVFTVGICIFVIREAGRDVRD